MAQGAIEKDPSPRTASRIADPRPHPPRTNPRTASAAAGLILAHPRTNPRTAQSLPTSPSLAAARLGRTKPRTSTHKATRTAGLAAARPECFLLAHPRTNPRTASRGGGLLRRPLPSGVCLVVRSGGIFFAFVASFPSAASGEKKPARCLPRASLPMRRVYHSPNGSLASAQPRPKASARPRLQTRLAARRPRQGLGYKLA